MLIAPCPVLVELIAMLLLKCVHDAIIHLECFRSILQAIMRRAQVSPVC